MIKQGVLNFVHPELKNMYEWLEVEFHPLRLSSKMEEGIKFVEKLAQPEYSQYMSALRDVTVVRLLQQVSQVYQTIELKRFISLAPPMDQHRLEKIIVNAARNNDVQVHIEHKSQALTFGTDLNVSTARSTGNDAGSKSNIVQKMPNEQIRNQLIAISRALYSCMEIVNEKNNKERNDKLRREIALTYSRDEPIQRKEILKRREVIERYKEDKEKEYKDKMRQAEIVSKTKQAERDEEDKTRREADQKRRQAEAALEKEKEEHRFAMKMAIDKLRESEIGRKIIEVIGEEELYKYDPNSINSLHIDAVIKHSREQKEKLKIQYKKVDYLIRAQHEAEVPLLQRQAEEENNRRREIQRAERERAIERRQCLIRMEGDKNEFLLSIRGQRHEDYVQHMREYEQRLSVARQQRLVQLRREYIEKKKQTFRREKELAKQRKREEEQQQIQAEIRRKEDERLAVRRAADEERNKKLADQARKQRERDEEIERKLQAEREAAYPATASSGTVRKTVSTASSHAPEKDRTDRFALSKFFFFDVSSDILVDYGVVIHVKVMKINRHILILLIIGVYVMMNNGKYFLG
jgi:translation initiation factor 3 subunit A